MLTGALAAWLSCAGASCHEGDDGQEPQNEIADLASGMTGLFHGSHPILFCGRSRDANWAIQVSARRFWTL